MISIRGYGVRIGVKNRVSSFISSRGMSQGNIQGEMYCARPAGRQLPIIPVRPAIICRQSDRRRDGHRRTPVLTQLGN